MRLTEPSSGAALRQSPARRRRLLGGLGAAILALLTLEGGARLALLVLGSDAAPIEVAWESATRRHTGPYALVYAPDPVLFFRLRPNLELAETGNPRLFDLRTNSLALRGPEVAIEKPAGSLRLIAVGDSCTFGSGAGTQQTYPAQLEQRLRALRPDLSVEVVNAGVPGFTSYQALRWLETEGFALSPDIVVFASAVNDAAPARAGGMHRFGATREFTDREFGLALRAQAAGWGITRLLWRLGIHLGAPPPEAAGPKRRVPLEEYRANLAAFAAQSAAHGATPVILAWPFERQVRGEPPIDELEAEARRYQEAARETAREQGVLFVDLSRPLAGRASLFIDVVHLNAAGYGVVAEAVATALEPLLPKAARAAP